MISRKLLYILYTIIALEGYVILATELLAIRQLIPFVGGGVEIMAIIISAVLLPLALGYYQGGKVRIRLRHNLRRNILAAFIILTFGQSYFILEWLFHYLREIEIHNRLILAAIYSTIFLVIPVYLLAQTIPVITNFLPKEKLSQIAGKILFFSTLGSFLGSIISTLILMNWIGVQYTAIFTTLLLAAMYVLVPNKQKNRVGYSILLLGIAALLWLNTVMINNNREIISYNAYNMASVYEENGRRTLVLNETLASSIGRNDSDLFPYVSYITNRFIHQPSADGKPRNMLILGAGGFTVGFSDASNQYTYVDIDSKLKHVAENYFLKKPLESNKRFIVSSARAFIINDHETYDFILMDAYTDIHAVPIEILNREFFVELKRKLKPDGILVMNYVGNAYFLQRYDVRFHNTFASVFPIFTRQVMEPLGTLNDKSIGNILYIYRNSSYADDRELYTDDLNTYSLDQY